MLSAIDRNCPLADLPDEALPDGGFSDIDLHWLSPKEMAERYADFPRALAAIDEVVARCSPALPSGEPIWPIPQLAVDQSVEMALASLAQQGLLGRYGAQPPKAAFQRLTRELSVIEEHGFSPLFLIVADIVRFARSQGIPVSHAVASPTHWSPFALVLRRSIRSPTICSSNVFSTLHAPAHPTSTSIFAAAAAMKCLHYVRDTYGAESVALVATISTMQPKSAVRETGKAHG